MDKWQLPIGENSLLDHLLFQIENYSNLIVLSCSVERPATTKIADVEIVPDEIPDAGPLEGIRCGLKRLAGRCELAFVTACDVPWFFPTVVDFLAAQIGDFQAAMPVIEQRVYGMTGIYRTDVHCKIEEMVHGRRLKVSLLSSELSTNRITGQQLQTVDPNLDTLKNINRPVDYFDYLEEIGEQCPAAVKARIRFNN